MTPEAILQKIKNAELDKIQGIAGTISDELLKSWLSDENWKIRNAAVKIISELKFSSYTDTLISFITDRTPAKLIYRLLGGDFYQVGFIRRNAVKALGCLGKSAPAVNSALLTAVNDNYWEVRSEAIKAIRKLCSNDPSSEIVHTLKSALLDKKFEVTVQAIYALGEISPNDEVLHDFHAISSHPNILVKTALVNALKILHKRGIISEENRIKSEINNIFVPGKHGWNNNTS